MSINNSQTLATLEVRGKQYACYSLARAEAQGLTGIARLPYTLKIVLENQLRQHAAGKARVEDVAALAEWLVKRNSTREIGFLASRVMMVDASGIPLLGDMAAMRDAMVRLGGDPKRINPATQVDFVVDHSVMVDHHATADAAERNMQIEFERNRERYAFMRWGATAFDNLRFIPPGSGICHQINLEYLARVVWTREENGLTLAYPDSVLGMDSHTPMINGLGIAGWGVGGLEGGAAALGEPVSMLIPEVVGCHLRGKLKPGVTATDLVLAITQLMRQHKVLAKFVEFFGSGVDTLTLPDRATIANMTPEYGATMGFFPVDAETLRYLRLTGRDAQQLALVEAYCKAQGLWRDAQTPVPHYSSVVELDLATVEAALAGPRRPHEHATLSRVPQAFNAAWPATKSAAVADNKTIRDGDVIIAAITSCTNTSNPSVMVGAGLLARNAVARGLKVAPWVKTSLAPGSRVVSDYLTKSGLQDSLDALGYHVAGYGCTTCMGNSGPIDEALATAIETNDIAAVAVLSGNRNFEGRIHPSVRANFLASPPLVVAYALAGNIRKDLTLEPLGAGSDGAPVYLRDIWPDPAEIARVIDATLSPQVFHNRYANIEEGPPEWRAIEAAGGVNFAWDLASTFIRRPPHFDTMRAGLDAVTDIHGARVLAMFGDMLTTDHISPIGAISPNTPAANYLQSVGVERKDFAGFAARRLNHDVMMRGTWANIRIRNEMTPAVEGSSTVHHASGEQLSIYDAAQRYREDKVPLVVVGGSEYGAGSSRDWAAKGVRLLGVRAIIAESFERIHRSNLVGMGVLPLQFVDGVTRKTLALDGSEVFDITGLEGKLSPRMLLDCMITYRTGKKTQIKLLSRLDTAQEVEYHRHGGILHYAIRQRLKQ